MTPLTSQTTGSLIDKLWTLSLKFQPGRLLGGLNEAIVRTPLIIMHVVPRTHFCLVHKFCVLNFKWPVFSKVVNRVMKQNYWNYLIKILVSILLPRKSKKSHYRCSCSSWPKLYISSVLPISFLTPVAASWGHCFVYVSEKVGAHSGLEDGMLCGGFCANLGWVEEMRPEAGICFGT